MITRRRMGLMAGAVLTAPGAKAETPLPPQAPGDVQPLTQDSLDALRQRCGAPALAAAAQRRGGRSRVWAIGVRMVGAPQPVTPTDQWHLGSISKSFLATLAARLVDQRK